MLGIDFNKEKKEGTLKVEKDFKGGIWEQLGYTHYICPECAAHLKEADNGDLICLNGCHMTERMRNNFSQMMKAVAERGK